MNSQSLARETQPSASNAVEGPAPIESRFPIFKDDEVYDGKPRQTTFTLSKESYDTERIVYDRKNPSRLINADKSGRSEIVNFNEDDFEVSFKIDTSESWTTRKENPIADSVKNDDETLAIFDVMSDLNSPTLVILGDIKLSETDAQKHLKEYRDYQNKKLLKNK